jgi:hypothetical protein
MLLEEITSTITSKTSKKLFAVDSTLLVLAFEKLRMTSSLICDCYCATPRAH